MSFLQAIGVASVLPFIALIMDPDLIVENHWLNLIYETFNFKSFRTFIVFTGLTMLFLIIISNVVSTFSTWLRIKFGLVLNHRISKRLLENYLNMPYELFLNRNSADLSNRVLVEVEKLTVYYVTPILTLFTKVMVSISILVMLLIVDVWVSLAAIFLLGGTYVMLFWRINRSLSLKGTLQAEAAENRFKAVSEALGGFKEVKVSNREHYFVDNYEAHSLNLASLNVWIQVISQLPRFALEAISFGGIILFVIYLLLTQRETSNLIPLVSLFAFAGYRLMPALQEIFQSATIIKYTRAILYRIHSDITQGHENESTDREKNFATIKPLKFEKQIIIKDVTYSYSKEQKPVLFQINMAIESNTAVAFVGPTGAGKTTLVDIILGLLKPQEGAVLVDGMPLKEENVKHWQRNFGYVPQNIYLSDDTITRNIAFGLPDSLIDFEAVKRSARIANIDDFINEELPGQYQTLVGERGVRLSGGQRQRIGIARALYHDPKVLVFDEATSALDGATEDTVLKALENTARLKTLIVIAHRVVTVKKCDQIYIINKGRIISSGSYNELLESDITFQKMAKSKT